MSVLQRHPSNPVLLPNPQNEWEAYAAFNGSVIKENGMYYMVYRAMSEEKDIKGKRMRMSTIGIASSKDGVHFENRSLFIKPEFEWEKCGCEDPRITKVGDQFFIFYTAISSFPPNASSIKCAVAISKDLVTITEKHLVTPFNAKAMTLFPEKINNMYTMFLSVNTDSPPTNIACAQFTNLETFWDKEFWSQWYAELDKHILNVKRVNSDQVEVGAPPLKTKYGWLLIYSYIKNYYSNSPIIFRIEAVLLDKADPMKIIGRLNEPCLIPETPYELMGQINNVVFPEGAIIDDGMLKVYYGAADSYCCLATTEIDNFLSQMNLHSAEAVKLKRFTNNPLLKPLPEHIWENKAVYNPAAIQINGKVYIVYQAVSQEDNSVFGMAISHDGLYIDERLSEPIYIPYNHVNNPDKGDSYGFEKPRLTNIKDTIIMSYNVFYKNTHKIAFTSIPVSAFLSRKWSEWTTPTIIPTATEDKDGILFPETVGGKYAFIHQMDSQIVVVYVDGLDFSNGKTHGTTRVISPILRNWDGVKINISTPPIKTNVGWLVFYHGISKVDNHFRLGALLLDENDISHITFQSLYPILESELYYEKEGHNNNKVYTCGSVVKNDDIFLYYSGADKVVCGAKMKLVLLLQYLTKGSTTSFLKPNE